MENNWRYKSLQSLEKNESGSVDVNASRLVNRCHELRRVPLNTFTVEDLRIMIGQEIGLQWLIPLALEILKENILAEGDLYPGDLLTNITKVSSAFWAINSDLKSELKELIRAKREVIEEEGLRTNWFE